MNAKVEKLENNQVKLEITIGADKFEEGMQKAFFRNAKYFNVPGFRKGKAPRNIVERYYGESVLYEEAFNIVVPEVYDEVIKENNIEAVAAPDIDITQIGKGKDLVFTATVTVKPEVKLGKYKGIKIDKKDYPVTEEDIQKHLDEMANKNARIITAEEGEEAKKVKEYGSGDYFGELALLSNEPRAASIIAKTDCKLLSLDRLAFKRLLGPIEKILKRNSEIYAIYNKQFK